MPFFPRILVHFVGLGDIIDQLRLRSLQYSVLLQAMPQLQQHTAVARQLTRQACGRSPLSDTAQDEYDLARSAMRVVKRRFRPGVEDASALKTAVVQHRSAVAAMHSQTPDLSAARARQSMRMQEAAQELVTGRFVHEINNGKIHDQPILGSTKTRSIVDDSTSNPRISKEQNHQSPTMSQD
jgi:hypothetical protein